MATSWLLDTNIWSAALRGEPRSVLNRLAALPAERLPVSALVLAELLTGAEMGTHRTQTLSAVRDLTEGAPILRFDAADAAAFAHIRATLERKGQPIGSMDMLIAAQAVARDLVLVTDNLREFKRVPGLKAENWLR